MPDDRTAEPTPKQLRVLAYQLLLDASKADEVDHTACSKYLDLLMKHERKEQAASLMDPKLVSELRHEIEAAVRKGSKK